MESREYHGRQRLIPETHAEIEMTRIVLRSLTGGRTGNGTTVFVGNHLGDGWYRLVANAPEPTIETDPDLPLNPDGSIDVLAILNRQIDPNSRLSVGGKISLVDNGNIEHSCLMLAWQYDGQPEYCGGDGPVSNGAFLLSKA